MKITFDIPNVQVCEVKSCAYNNGGQTCHARAITIGDGIHAACDTFFVSDRHTRNTSDMAGVGACKVTVAATTRTSSARRRRFVSAFTTAMLTA